MRERLKQVWCNEEGVSIVYMALMLVILLGMAGIALDGSNAYAQRRRMQTAADAAAAAGTRLLALEETTAGIGAEVQKIATTNGATSATWSITEDGKGVNVSVEHEVDTYFARVMGYNSITVSAVAQAGYAPVTSVGNLTPLAINGCDCVNFDSLPAPVDEDSFSGGVVQIYDVDNDTYSGVSFVLQLPGLDSAYTVETINRPYYTFHNSGSGELTEYGNGGAVWNDEVSNTNGDGFEVEIELSGRTSTAPSGLSPRCTIGCPKNYTDWYYYTTVSGKLTGFGPRYAGAVITVSGRGAAFQIGEGASIYSDELGGAGEISLEVVTQPTTGVELTTPNDESEMNMLLIDPDAADEEEVVAPTSVVIALNDNKNSSYKVELVSHVGASWTYKVTELTGRSLSHWDLGIENCLGEIVSYTPTSGYAAGTDGSTGFVGIKWDTEDSFTSGEFTFVLDKSYPTTIVNALVKAGTQSNTGAIAGPDCDGTEEEEDPEVEFCTYNLNVNPGDTFDIRDYVHYKDGDYEDVAIDWNDVYLTYTEAGADDPTNPEDWNLTAFNAGESVTVTSEDAASGTGNHGDGEYRIYIVRNSQSEYDDHMTIRVSEDGDSDVEDAKCAGAEDPPPTTETPCELAWLDWNGGIASNGEIVDYLNNPSSSGTWSVGDWVNAGPEVANVAAVADALEEWLNEPMTIVLYGDGDQDSGYQICGFAEFTLEDFDFASLPPWIQGNFDPSTVRSEEVDVDAADFGLRDVRFE